GGGGTQRLARRIGPNRAFELLATGEALPAQTFADLGLVSHLTDGDPMDKALALATTMAGHAPAALKAIKSLTQLAGESALGAALDREAEALHHLFLTTDARKHIAAFAAKSEARRAEKEAKS
ncbi:MAG: enoyl-CoA hydratase-related protein, partial [Pseudomonadota bacterium]